jgi:hypothetical protein
MDQIVRLMGDIPDASFRPAELGSPAYTAFYIYPVIAYREALLRFPQAAQRLRWRWGLAYSLARLGDPEAVSMFQDFLLAELNQAGISLTRLPAFVHDNLPDLTRCMT